MFPVGFSRGLGGRHSEAIALAQTVHRVAAPNAAPARFHRTSAMRAHTARTLAFFAALALAVPAWGQAAEEASKPFWQA